MSPFYYKYIDPIVDYLQPLPKILSDQIVLGTVFAFGIVLIIWAVLFAKELEK